MGKKFDILREIAITKDQRKINNKSDQYLNSDRVISPGVPKRAGIDATERVNRLYYKFIKR
ncbi:hypothetical protein BD780_001130 [Clostridium tetanomorphum]|uniref:Uncharacterized protein n=1 Tax=Clostridium tetanomorphum TaxID=1553 RepID=A0A923E7H0_CLOTT|nr:hypothetical protein [Clostridium tetanomorphum]KAJ49632.1 hypothetical protein CTM_22103 [Clostridium tetanomorphum DSM 665]KAJ52434.1 hypothetical protein CTM_08046 [Clostridium tetanomorphum DSM 665]MBC2397952.1 hypothetical protein [Clostridium tetanomorphum]MBP1864728.1 hypothetical protein [Clostridium tetanomorphum]NRS83905.1 hypothetical protein [Clostridium tetanomorphum]